MRAALAVVVVFAVVGLSTAVVLASASPDAPPRPPPAPAGDVADSPSLTIYSTADPAGFDPQRFVAQQKSGGDPQFAWQVPGFGVVRETRRATMSAGVNEVRAADVAQFIDPTSVSCVDATDPGASVVEQSFRFDLASERKILERYVDRDVSLEGAGDGARLAAKLLSADEGKLVLQTAAGIQFVDDVKRVHLPELPDGLITRPTLVWRIEAARAGEHELRTAYQTGGLTWRADYNLVLDASNRRGDLGAWVSLMNLSGATFCNAQLKLIAGDVHRIAPARAPGSAGFESAGRAVLGAVEAFDEKPFFEYHLYTLPRRVDVPKNSTQQLTLFPTAQGIDVEKVLMYCGAPSTAESGYAGSARAEREFGRQSNPKVDVFVRFKNEEKNKLGMPLPRGKLRVWQQDPADGTLEFVGENLIDHTPRDEPVLLHVGESFDVTGERVQTDFDKSTWRNTITEGFRISLHNHKDADVRVVVHEALYRWSNWEIQKPSDPYTKIDARTIHFDVVIPARGEKTVAYSVRYTW